MPKDLSKKTTKKGDLSNHLKMSAIADRKGGKGAASPLSQSGASLRCEVKKSSKKSLNIDNFANKQVIGSVDYTKVKSALTGRNLQTLCQIYELFIRFDTQISSQIDTRRKKIAALPFLLKCENEKQKEFLLDYLNSGEFRLFLFDLTSAIAYGFSVFIKEWFNDNGKILPKYKFIEHSFFENDKTRLVFKNTGEKYYLDETENTFTYLHPSDTGDFINSSLMYKSGSFFICS